MNKRKNVSFLILSFVCTFSISAMELDCTDQKDKDMDYLNDLKKLKPLQDKATELETSLKDFQDLQNERVRLYQEALEIKTKLAPDIIKSLHYSATTLDNINFNESDDSSSQALILVKNKYRALIANTINQLTQRTDFNLEKMQHLLGDIQLFATIVSKFGQESVDEVIEKLKEESFIPYSDTKST